MKGAGSSTLDKPIQPKKSDGRSRQRAMAADSEELSLTSGFRALVTSPRTAFRGWITRKKPDAFQTLDDNRIKGHGLAAIAGDSSILVRFGRYAKPHARGLAHRVALYSPASGPVCFGEVGGGSSKRERSRVLPVNNLGAPERKAIGKNLPRDAPRREAQEPLSTGCGQLVV